MKRLRLATTLLAATMGLSLALTGCEEKKPVEQPKPPEEKKEEVKPPPPPPPPQKQEEHALTECAAPLELAAAQEVKVGDKAATDTGYKLTFKDKDADGTLVLGVLGPVNEDSGANMVALKKYLKFFTDEKADAIVVTGDSGEVADGIARVLKTVAASKLPVLVIVGNRECRADYTDGVNAAKAEFPNIVNMNVKRAVEFPEATLVSLPGYHDPTYIACDKGCAYYKSTVDEVVKLAKEAKTPVVLVSHGPPRGEGSQALDFATGGGNVGDAQIPQLIKDGNIAFGVASNIKEAGGRATDLPGTTLIKQDTWVKNLYLNPGPADTVGWDMNDGTKSNGSAAVLKIKGDTASWKLLRLKPMTAAEKAEAKKLEPPARPEPTDEKDMTKDEPMAGAKDGGAAEKKPMPPPGNPEGTK